MKRKLLFPKEVKSLMYGFGDSKDPLPESIEIMDEMLENFIVDLCERSLKLSVGKIKTNDFLAQLEGDDKKLARAHELLHLDKELKQARATFGDSVKLELAL